MNILVTGGTGFIGTNLIKKLLEDKDNNLFSYDSYYIGKIENEQPGCKYYHQDLAETYWYIEAEIDLVYHLAAFSRIQPSIKNPTSTLKNNYLSTLNILQTAADNGVPVIYSGSSSFHSGLYESPYAWSKHSGEQMCRLFTRIYKLRTMICRFYNVYGPHQILEGTYATVVGIFQNQFKNGEPLTITGDGEQRRDFTHVDDIVDGLIGCVEKDFKAEEFELGSGVNYSINEVADMFGNAKKEYISPRPGEYDKTLCDYSKAKKHLKYEPEMNLKKYVKQWLGENK